MFRSVVYEFLLMTQSKTYIFLIGQYNKLKTKSKNEFPSEHISVSGVGRSTNRVVLFSSIVEGRPKKDHLKFVFPKCNFSTYSISIFR